MLLEIPIWPIGIARKHSGVLDGLPGIPAGDVCSNLIVSGLINPLLKFTRPSYGRVSEVENHMHGS